MYQNLTDDENLDALSVTEVLTEPELKHLLSLLLRNFFLIYELRMVLAYILLNC